MHNFKKIGKAVFSIVAFFLILKAMDIALYPCTFMRNDVHTVTTNERDVIILGTSHGKMDLDPDQLLKGTGKTGHNLCVGGEYPVDSYYLTKLIMEKQNPKQIIFELDPGYFTTEKEPGNNYLLFYHEFPASVTKLAYYWDTMLDCDFRATLFPFYEYPLSYELPRIKDTLKQKLTNDYDVSNFKGEAQEYHENGFIERYPVDTSQLKENSLIQFSEAELKETNIEYLDKLIQLCKENDIEFIAATMPLPAVTLVKYQDNYNEAWDYFTKYFDDKGVEYYNFNREYYQSFSHDLADYTDYDGHMNGESAREFSSMFGQMLY